MLKYRWRAGGVPITGVTGAGQPSAASMGVGGGRVPLKDSPNEVARERMNPMTAYLALTQNVADVDKYLGEYVPPVLQLFEKYGIEVLAAQFGASAIEGSANSVVILRAESEDAFRNLYDDPDLRGPESASPLDHYEPELARGARVHATRLTTAAQRCACPWGVRRIGPR